jgi:subtilisin family serine protease
VRLTPLPAAALLVLLASPVAAQAAADGAPAARPSAAPARVTAVVQDAAGHLTFRHGSAAGPLAARALARHWRTQPGVVATAVDSRVHVTGTPDPLRPQQWGLAALRAGEVGVATGQVVAVVDTGVDGSHPDLTGVVLPGADIVSGSGDARTDPNGHGTHVAGVVAAVADNGVGGAGLATGASILPVRVMGADGTGWDSDAAKGVVWAADHGATVVNLSFGGSDPSPVMDSAVKYALGHGVSVVVAAGNAGDSTNPVEWPAADPGVIAVGALDASGVRPAWSSTGPHLAVTAPGVDILSTVPTAISASGYATWSGTSMAAPFVSAAVALLRHAQPSLTVAGLRQRLMDTADDLGAPGFDPEYGAGRVDVLAAEAAGPAAGGTATPTTTTGTAPVATASTPVLSARISADRTTVPATQAVTLAARVLTGGAGAGGVAARLERLVGGSWVLTRTGQSGDGGLVSWVLHPDRTASYRVVGSGWSSPTLRIAVTPVVTLLPGTAGVTGRVLPAGVTAVRIDLRRSTGWVGLATVSTSADGRYRLGRAFSPGTVLRAVALGVASPARRV